MEDKIIIDGVEYEQCRSMPFMVGDEGHLYLVCQEKRKQMGWICRGCDDTAQCLIDYDNGSDHAPTECPYEFGAADWKPFYGKVTDDE